MGGALDFLIAGTLVELLKYNGNPIGLELPTFVELEVAFTEPGVRGDSSSGSGPNQPGSRPGWRSAFRCLSNRGKR